MTKVDSLSTLTIAMIDYFDRRKPLGMKGITNEEALELQSAISKGDFKALEVFIKKKRVQILCYGMTPNEAIEAIKDAYPLNDKQATMFYNNNIKK